jgi:hypothetical protein
MAPILAIKQNKRDANAKVKWQDYNGVDSPFFNDKDIVEVEYRDGRRSTGDEPWMFSGWQWWAGGTSPRDIVKWRLVK